MESTIPFQIWATLLPFIGMGFLSVLVLNTWTSGTAQPGRRSRSALAWGLLGLAAMIGAGLLLVSARMSFSRSAQMQDAHESAQALPPRVAVPETKVSPIEIEAPLTSELKTVTPSVDSSLRQTVSWPIRGGLAILLAILIGSSQIRRKTQTAAPAAAVQPRRTGLVWLLLPIGWLAILIVIAAPAMVAQIGVPPTVRVRYTTTEKDRMQRTVQDLLANSAEQKPGNPPVPDWIKKAPSEPYKYILSSQQYSSLKEAEEELLPIAADLLQRSFHEHLPWQGAWNVPLSQVRDRVVEQEFLERRTLTTGKFEGDVYRVHMLINVSPEVRETFVAAWKSQIVSRRLQIFGVFLGWGSLMLLLGRTYFSALARLGPDRYWGTTLKAVAASVVVTALASIYLVELVPYP